jgi:hypothetical protein
VINLPHNPIQLNSAAAPIELNRVLGKHLKPETYSTISIDLGFYVDETYAVQVIVNPRDEVFFGIQKALINVVLASNLNFRLSIVSPDL